MEINTQIKKYCTDLKLSQEELAEKIYVSRQTVSNWEIEKHQECGKRSYQRILLALRSGLIAFLICMLVGVLKHLG